MSARAPLPRYIPPPTTFLLSRPSVTYGTKPLPNRHWNIVRTNVQSKTLQAGNRNGHDSTSSYGDEPKWMLRPKRSEGQQNQSNGPQTMRYNGVNRQNDGQKDNEYQRKKFEDGEEEEPQIIEHQQLHYAQPDFSRIFDEEDEINENNEENKHEEARPRTSDHNTGSSKEENGAISTVNEDYDDDMDWQKKVEKDDDKKYDWSRNRNRNNSVYDPETTKIRAQKIDQTSSEPDGKDRNEVGSGDVRGKSRRLSTTKIPEMATTGNRQESEGTANSGEEEKPSTSELIKEEEDAVAEAELLGGGKGEEIQANIEGNEQESKHENEGVKDDQEKAIKRRLKNLNDAIKKCTSKFAEKLLDVLEQQKSDCMIQFDDICKKHEKDNSEPIFSSYSCENGQTTESIKDSIKKKVYGLVGGVYTKACEGADAIREAAEELIDEIKPQDDGSWSQIGGDSGIRCVPHYDNRVEDHTVYVCSCCFNEVIERDAHVNVKYFDPDFGCCKPKIVSRSFENRPYFCEKLLSSMSKKRRSCFLKMYGKKHQMKGGVHCISVIPSMEQEFLAHEGKLESCNGGENFNAVDGSRAEN